MIPLNPLELSERENYAFLTGAIVPRPIALISTISNGGVINIAPFSYFTIVSSNPPMIAVSIQRRSGERKDTARNAIDSGEFVVHITDEDIASDNTWIYIDKELQRADYSVMQTLGNKDVFQVFPCVMEGAATRLVLKAPKTESSVRRIWLPKTLAYILRKWQEAQQEVKDFLGNEYQDFDLVVAHKNGRPVDNRIIEKEFERLKKAAELPNVVFHSLRHSSTTYKLKLNHGDIKATQGDTGHSEIEMITKVYAHILDEDRKLNAQKFDSQFYTNPDLRKVSVPSAQPVSAEQLLTQLKESPELLNTLAKLLAGNAMS